jgi:neutral trehalase
VTGPYLALSADKPVGLSTGRPRSLEEIRRLIGEQRMAWERRREAAGDLAELWDAMQTGLAWNTIYEPLHDRIVCPVSRRWSLNNRGYVQYLWDTYFAAYQATAVGERELAYVNLVEMTRAKHKAERPFVPNVEQANGFLSRDRSQPPVGSLCAREAYRAFGDTWILELLYPDLREWNEWWHRTRRYDDLLCYGSTPYEPVIGNRWETETGEAVNGWFGASMESGWDGGVLYRNVPFDKERHHLKHWDAALNGLYVLDCRALADIARVIGDEPAAAELDGRADAYRKSLQKLWNEEIGFYQNRNWETGEFSEVIAVNGFYPLIAGAATDEQAVRLVTEHLLNPNEFWGTWAVSTLSRSHPAFGREGEYWDGRVWPPVNFLVYLGLRNYQHVPEVARAAAKLVENSRELLLGDFRERRLIRENYDVDTGSGVEAEQSAAFYHWGGLLGLMTFLQTGTLPGPEGRLVR